MEAFYQPQVGTFRHETAVYLLWRRPTLATGCTDRSGVGGRVGR